MTYLLLYILLAIVAIFIDVSRLWRAHKRLERRMESEISGRREFMDNGRNDG